MKCLIIPVEKSGLSLDVPDNELETYLCNFFKKFDLSQIDNIIITNLLECYHSDHLAAIQKIINCSKKITQKKTIAIFNEWYRTSEYFIPFLDNEADAVLYINALMYWVYQSVIIKKESKGVQQYKKNNKWLFLIGKPDKTQRIGVLYQLYKKNLYSYGNWSLYIHNDYIKSECKKYLPEMDADEFETFINSSIRTLDNPPIQFFPDGSHFSGIPYDWRVYDDCGFQVIGESDINYAAHTFTEKTYLSIINKRPFIVFTSMGALHKLEKMGFKTFREHLLIKNYNDEYECNDVMPVVLNIEHWVNNIEKQYEKINLDVEHNYKRFVDLARKEGATLKDFIKTHELDCEPDNIIKGY